ncbi:hypothetical protein [Azospirillum sp. sgz302134]
MTDTPQPMEPTFRSPLLAPRDQGSASRPRRRSARKLAILLAGGALLVVLAAGTVGRWWAPSGPGAWLYAMHDGFYLPLKGNLWTRLYPASAIVAGAIGLVALVLSFRQRVFGPLHRHCLKALIAFPASHGLLAGWVEKTAGTRLAPQMLCKAVDLERRRCLDAVIAALRAGRMPEEPAERLIALTRLLLRTSCVCMPAAERALEGAATVLETLVWRLLAPPALGHPLEIPDGFAGLTSWAAQAGVPASGSPADPKASTACGGAPAAAPDPWDAWDLVDEAGRLLQAMLAPSVHFSSEAFIGRVLDRVDALEHRSAVPGPTTALSPGVERLAFLIAAATAMQTDAAWLLAAHTDALQAARFADDCRSAAAAPEPAPADTLALDEAWLVAALTARANRSSIVASGIDETRALFGANACTELLALDRMRAAAAASEPGDDGEGP